MWMEMGARMPHPCGAGLGLAAGVSSILEAAARTRIHCPLTHARTHTPHTNAVVCSSCRWEEEEARGTTTLQLSGCYRKGHFDFDAGTSNAFVLHTLRRQFIAVMLQRTSALLAHFDAILDCFGPVEEPSPECVHTKKKTTHSAHEYIRTHTQPGDAFWMCACVTVLEDHVSCDLPKHEDDGRSYLGAGGDLLVLPHTRTRTNFTCASTLPTGFWPSTVCLTHRGTHSECFSFRSSPLGALRRTYFVQLRAVIKRFVANRYPCRLKSTVVVRWSRCELALCALVLLVLLTALRCASNGERNDGNDYHVFRSFRCSIRYLAAAATDVRGAHKACQSVSGIPVSTWLPNFTKILQAQQLCRNK